MDKYSPPPNEEMLLLTLECKKRMKKSLKECIFFEKTKQVFLNFELLGTSAYICALCDSIPLLRYDKKSPFFIDSQWIIDEKIGGKEFYQEIQRLANEVRNSKKVFIWT